MEAWLAEEEEEGPEGSEDLEVCETTPSGGTECSEGGLD